jgi:hypothetical protein
VLVASGQEVQSWCRPEVAITVVVVLIGHGSTLATGIYRCSVVELSCLCGVQGDGSRAKALPCVEAGEITGQGIQDAGGPLLQARRHERAGIEGCVVSGQSTIWTAGHRGQQGGVSHSSPMRTPGRVGPHRRHRPDQWFLGLRVAGPYLKGSEHARSSTSAYLASDDAAFVIGLELSLSATSSRLTAHDSGSAKLDATDRGPSQ